MGKLQQHSPKVEVSATLTLTEEEMRAFDALVGYGVDAFLKVFYEHLGKSYMERHEAGLRSLFATQGIATILRRADAARQAFSQKDKPDD